MPSCREAGCEGPADCGGGECGTAWVMGTEGSRFATACRTTFDVCRVDQHCWDEFSYRFCWPSELVAPPSEVGRVWACEDIEIDG